jgi:asparagine synthetase B (glutamine-hydrolysing)
MCSFLITNKKSVDYLSANSYQRLRGPDRTSIEYVSGYIFLHNLLSITGEFSSQPFNNGSQILLYNGEIYNYKKFGNFKSDGWAILSAFEKYGLEFSSYLDGEFAAVIYDIESDQFVFSTDVFATKPLYVGIDGLEFGISSYESVLKSLDFKNIQKVPANSTFLLSAKNGSLKKVANAYEFSIEQYKNNYDDWIKAFVDAVKKRAVHGREALFIGLSSGYDSGAISCVLNEMSAEYIAYTLEGREDEETLRLRFSRIKNNSISKLIPLEHNLLESARKHLYESVEDYYFKIYSSVGDYNEFGLELKQDQGAVGLSVICNQARKDKRKVYLSGQGADEILSDYGFGGQRIYKHSNFGGKYPSDLSTIFPWASFYGSSQESYLMKEEQVAGSYGIEARYPFLDKYLVQEFLHLNVNLKNKRYKAPLAELFEKYDYPFKANQKIGFSITR